MASFFRRRRGLLIKAVIVIPVFWFIAVVVFGRGSQLTSGTKDDDGGIMPEKKNVQEKPLQPPDNQVEQGHDRKIHDLKPNDQDNPNINDVQRGNAAQLEQDRLRREEEEKKRKKEEEDAEAKKDKPLHFEPEKKEQVPVDPNAPGENGRAVSIDKEKLSPEERKKFDDGWQKNAYNQYASDMVSLHRSLPDVRDKDGATASLLQNNPRTVWSP